MKDKDILVGFVTDSGFLGFLITHDKSGIYRISTLIR